jgi:hypothetical protein
MTCPTGKRAFTTDLDARRELRRIRKAGKHDRRAGGRERRAYACPRCGLWHLTKQPYRPHQAA